MSRDTVRASTTTAVVATMLTAFSGLVATATAAADADSYLRKLYDAGISVPRGDFELKEWGYEVCLLRAIGKTPRQWVEQAVYQSALHPPYGLTEDQANFIVDTAVSELCEDRDGPPPYGPKP